VQASARPYRRATATGVSDTREELHNSGTLAAGLDEVNYASVSSNRGPYFSQNSRFVSLFLFFSAIVLTTFYVLHEQRKQLS
jgi:hypothetical protein